MELLGVTAAGFWPGLVEISQSGITGMWCCRCLCHPVVPVMCFPPQLGMALLLVASPCRGASCSGDPVPVPPSELLRGWGHHWWQCPTTDALLALAKEDLIPTSAAARRQAGLSLHGESEVGIWVKASWRGLEEALLGQRSCEPKRLKDPCRC